MAREFNDGTLAGIVEIREEVRVHEGSGGQCFFVAEVLQQRFGWEVGGGVYLARGGEPIGDHHWSVLPDGSILDATADQFCEGHDVRLVRTDDPEFARYRAEWHEDYHPGHPDFPELADVEWSGELDCDWSARLRLERGNGWWLPDPSALREWEPPAEAARP